MKRFKLISWLILCSLSNVEKAESKKTIVINNHFGLIHHWLEFVISVFLQKRGHKVYFISDILCNSKFPQTHFYNSKFKKLVSLISFCLNYIFYLICIVILFLNGVKIVAIKKTSINSNYNQFKFIINEIIRKWSGKRNFQSKKTEMKITKSLLNYANTFFSIVSTKSPDSVFTSHGIYQWGIVNLAEIKTIIYGRQVYIPGTFKFSLRPFVFGDLIGPPLNQKINFKSRLEGKESDQENFFCDNHKDQLDFISKINSERGNKKVVLLTPNCVWDGDINIRDIFFDGVVDWISRTYSYFKESDKVLLLIRSHPGEINIWKGMTKLSDEIPSLKQYEFFLDSDSKVNTYDLIKLSDLVITYSGFITLESAIIKGYSLCVANNPYSELPGVITAENWEDYVDFIENNNFSNINNHNLISKFEKKLLKGVEIPNHNKKSLYTFPENRPIFNDPFFLKIESIIIK